MPMVEFQVNLITFWLRYTGFQQIKKNFFSDTSRKLSLFHNLIRVIPTRNLFKTT